MGSLNRLEGNPMEFSFSGDEHFVVFHAAEFARIASARPTLT
jgi:hypothetical protein